MDSAAAARLLLGSCQFAEFLGDYWEQKPLFVGQSDADAFRQLLVIDDLDHALSSYRLTLQDLRIANVNDELTPAATLRSAFATVNQRVDVDEVLNAFAEGSTLIFNAVDKYHPPLLEFAEALEECFSCGVQANVYLSPAGSQGFPSHYDTHNVFLLQIAGEKQWKACPSDVQYPLKSQPSRSERATAAAPWTEFRLQAGDSLYIPRGWLHEGTACNEASCHITIGVHSLTMSDLLAELVADHSLQDAECRKSLPIEAADIGAMKASVVRDQLARIQSSLSKTEIFDLRNKLHKNRRSKHRPRRRGRLASMAGLSSLSADSTVVNNMGRDAYLSSEEDRVVLNLHGKAVSFPEYACKTLEFILAQERFAVKDISTTIDSDGRLTLVRRLIREGALRFGG